MPGIVHANQPAEPTHLTEHRTLLYRVEPDCGSINARNVSRTAADSASDAFGRRLRRNSPAHATTNPFQDATHDISHNFAHDASQNASHYPAQRSILFVLRCGL